MRPDCLRHAGTPSGLQLAACSSLDQQMVAQRVCGAILMHEEAGDDDEMKRLDGLPHNCLCSSSLI